MLPLLVVLGDEVSSSKLIHYLFQPSISIWTPGLYPVDNIILNATNKRYDQSVLGFQTGIGAAVHATLKNEQLISHIGTAFGDTLTSLQGLDREVIPVFRCA